MHDGTVQFFHATRGYGFIQPADGGGDLFFHVSAIDGLNESELQPGTSVCFDIERDGSGRARAVNVTTGAVSGRGRR